MNIQQMTDRYIFQTYRRYPLAIKRAKGSWVWDDRGKRYLDFFSGLAVAGIGHNHPKVLAAIRKQSAQLLHSSNYYYNEPSARLARELCQRSFAGKVFFCNSGAEANETAIKLARRWGRSQGDDRYEIIVLNGGFHGRTLGALAATAQEKYRKGFGPLPEGFRLAELNDFPSVEWALTSRTCAILVEPIQGEGGIYPAYARFLKDLRTLAEQKKLLLIFDEVQCGLGRTGSLFAYQSYGVEPDVLTLAKGLAGGLPLAATLARERLGGLLGPGDHGCTFGGNPVCCAAGLAVLSVLKPSLFKTVSALGKFLLKELQNLAKPYPWILDVRGTGLMWGIELSRPGDPIVTSCRKAGLLINCIQEKVLRLLPPLTLSWAEARQGLAILKRAFDSINRNKI